ncbi:hypothetical protein PCANC_13782 [Puccinia coronata f. sp. avenae]|uniref:BED-type domain-containing protein n=1 Tax=Puccinia coronata f. sp. avenae TaxID=200324 RepID=A0A2N5V268_9BASI|nr:hypothetical protein PCANC_13782 [Puccinia coronata f. sp. avenae]
MVSKSYELGSLSQPNRPENQPRRSSRAEELKKKPITFNCKWCQKKVRGGYNSNANLRKHRDGSNQAGRGGSGCPNQNLAIEAGAKIPPTVDETRALAAQKDNGNKKLTAFFGQTEKFDKKVLNQILTIWQTQNGLPWSRIEDFHLKAAFHYSKADSALFKRRWAATEAKSLYISLQNGMLEKLKKSSSKFTLIHDFWTTKGNRYAFIGSSVAYVDDDWEFNMTHLSLKLVSWFHQGKWLAEPLANTLQKHELYPKINSASSNNTMASRIFDLLAAKNGAYAFDWRPVNMHIRCFCHKIALIVNAGLAELGISAPPPPKIKESVLGAFPFCDNMETILEEDEEEDENITSEAGAVLEIDMDEEDNSEPEHDEEELEDLLKQNQIEEFIPDDEGEYQATNRNESNSLDRLTKKVNANLNSL